MAYKGGDKAFSTVLMVILNSSRLSCVITCQSMIPAYRDQGVYLDGIIPRILRVENPLQLPTGDDTCGHKRRLLPRCIVVPFHFGNIVVSGLCAGCHCAGCSSGRIIRGGSHCHREMSWNTHALVVWELLGRPRENFYRVYFAAVAPFSARGDGTTFPLGQVSPCCC